MNYSDQVSACGHYQHMPITHITNDVCFSCISAIDIKYARCNVDMSIAKVALNKRKDVPLVLEPGAVEIATARPQLQCA